MYIKCHLIKKGQVVVYSAYYMPCSFYLAVCLGESSTEAWLFLDNTVGSFGFTIIYEPVPWSFCWLYCLFVVCVFVCVCVCVCCYDNTAMNNLVPKWFHIWANISLDIFLECARSKGMHAPLKLW
jgi:hypothetical protein